MYTSEKRAVFVNGDNIDKMMLYRALSNHWFVVFSWCVMQHWSTGGASVSNQQSSQHDFLGEPSPLGLRLKKSPSLVDLIQMKLVQAGKAKDARHCGTAISASEKLKASNFPGSILRIGSWEVSTFFYVFIHATTLLFYSSHGPQVIHVFSRNQMMKFWFGVTAYMLSSCNNSMLSTPS